MTVVGDTYMAVMTAAVGIGFFGPWLEWLLLAVG